MNEAAEKLDVVSFGEILWDVFEVKPGTFVRELGGAPANLAVTLARLGIRAAVVGGVGRDRFGDDLHAFLTANGVDARFLIRLANRTGIAFVSRDENGEPSFLFYRHQTADMSIEPKHVTPAMSQATWTLIGTSTLMPAGLARAGLAEATHRFVQNTCKSGAHLVVDLNVRAHLWKNEAGMRRAIAGVLEHAMLVKASSADLVALGVGDERAGFAWTRKYAKKASIVITRGKGTAAAIGAHGEVGSAAKPARCVDATGAGDAFTAGVLASLCAARAVPDAAAWKSAKMWTRALA
ncbi:MAG: carbohydrate kinase family protein, partial [Polyangiaceae bacterium]